MKMVGNTKQVEVDTWILGPCDVVYIQSLVWSFSGSRMEEAKQKLKDVWKASGLAVRPSRVIIFGESHPMAKFPMWMSFEDVSMNVCFVSTKYDDDCGDWVDKTSLYKWRELLRSLFPSSTYPQSEPRNLRHNSTRYRNGDEVSLDATAILRNVLLDRKGDPTDDIDIDKDPFQMRGEMKDLMVKLANLKKRGRLDAVNGGGLPLTRPMRSKLRLDDLMVWA